MYPYCTVHPDKWLAVPHLFLPNQHSHLGCLSAQLKAQRHGGQPAHAGGPGLQHIPNTGMGWCIDSALPPVIQVARFHTLSFFTSSGIFFVEQPPHSSPPVIQNRQNGSGRTGNRDQSSTKFFKDCVDLFSCISTARSMGRDADILNTRLDVERPSFYSGPSGSTCSSQVATTSLEDPWHYPVVTQPEHCNNIIMRCWPPNMKVKARIGSRLSVKAKWMPLTGYSAP